MCFPRASVVCLAALSLIGCRTDMHDQPRYEPLDPSRFFADGRSARDPVPGTVARGQLRLDAARFSGKVGSQTVAEFPFPITRADLVRGRERFDIFCSPCHGSLGDGDGMVVRRGLRQAASFHSDKLRNAPIGHFFDVITNGFGSMPRYNYRIPVDDRWRITAYVRALQYSQNAGIQDVPPEERTRLEASPTP